MNQPYFAHPKALVESESVGDGTRVWAFAHVMEGARVGTHCNIGGHAFVESGAMLGDYVTLKNGVMVWDGVRINNGAFIGPGVVFTNDQRPRTRRWPRLNLPVDPKTWLKTTLVGEGATIGAGSTIVCGIEIGTFAMIGAGSLVTSSVPAHAFGFGVPFKIKGYVCECGIELKGTGKTETCLSCGKTISMNG